MSLKSVFTTTHTDKYGNTRTDIVTHRVLAVVGVACAAFILLASLWPLRTVPTGTRGVITVGGAIKGIESEGFTLVAPWQRLTIFSVRAEEAQIDNAEGSTSDTQPVHVSMTVRYSITPDKVAEDYERYSHDGNLASYIQTATAESFKAVTSKYSAPDLIAKRSDVSRDILAALQSKVEKYGAQVINIDMRSFAFSDSYMKAINDKVTQEQLRLAAENKLRTVEAEQKQKVAIAEAEAAAKVKTAEADAKSIQLQGEALRANQNLLELKRVEVEMEKAKKWDGKLPQNLYASAPIPIMNLGK